MRLLDLFCGAGGCAVGYHRAGFTDIVGVDIKPQPRYPFAFVQGDALEYLAAHGREFDAIHASPPCQAYSRASFTNANRSRHPDLLGPTRTLLVAAKRPWVIENVEGAPVEGWPVNLCGLMFGLKVFRHRWFESSVMLMQPSHPSHRGKKVGANGFRSLIGHGGGASKRQRNQMLALGARDDKASWVAASGIDWMTRDEMAQAIPPAYTEFVGRQLLDHINHAKRGGGE